jgi:hypothetical protein
MVSVHEWDGDMAAAVVSCETEEKFEGRGKDRKLVGVTSLDCGSVTSNGVQSVVSTVDSRTSFGDIIRSQWLTTVRNDQVEVLIQVR